MNSQNCSKHEKWSAHTTHIHIYDYHNISWHEQHKKKHTKMVEKNAILLISCAATAALSP